MNDKFMRLANAPAWLDNVEFANTKEYSFGGVRFALLQQTVMGTIRMTIDLPCIEQIGWYPEAEMESWDDAKMYVENAVGHWLFTTRLQWVNHDAA